MNHRIVINYPAAELRGMSETVVKERRLATVYLFVRSTLVFDIVFDCLFAGILANRVYIIPLRPELSAPQLLLHFGVCGEDHFGSDAFDGLHHFSGSEVRYRLDEKMHMVFVRTNLVESDLEPLLDAETHVLQRLGDL